jgi:hypothetical protein
MEPIAIEKSEESLSILINIYNIYIIKASKKIVFNRSTSNTRIFAFQHKQDDKT